MRPEPKRPVSTLGLARRPRAWAALWYAARLAAPPPRAGPGLRACAASALDVGDDGVPARRRGADRRADLRRQRRRAAHQRRRDLPGLPRDDPRGASTTINLAHLRLLAGRHRPRGRRAAGRARARRASRSTSCSTRSARRRWSATCIDDMRDAGVLRRALPPAQALRAAPPEQPHAPQAADRRRPRRDDRRRRDRRGVDGRRPGPRPLARHPRPRPRAGRARAAGRVRRELARGDRRRARRRRLPARARAGRRRRADAGRALARRRRRHERRGAVLPRHRVGARVARPDRRVLRAAAGVHRGAVRGGRPRRRRAHPRPGPAHRQGVRPPAPGARAYEQLLECGVADLRVPARRCCTPRRWSSTARGRRSAR